MDQLLTHIHTQTKVSRSTLLPTCIKRYARGEWNVSQSTSSTDAMLLYSQYLISLFEGVLSTRQWRSKITTSRRKSAGIRVHTCGLGWDVFAPAPTKICTMSRSPARAAKCNGQIPERIAIFGFAPVCTKYLHISAQIKPISISPFWCWTMRKTLKARTNSNLMATVQVWDR